MNSTVSKETPLGKRLPLAEAIDRFVRPGDHIHFACTPSRSNVAIAALCRSYCGKAPAFTLSMTGFHSAAHALGRNRLGERYLGCFFGDVYPVPRPNPIYTDLVQEGACLQHWSLLTMVNAFRAAALGLTHAVVRARAGTDLGAGLNLVRLDRDQALVPALRPDVTVIHGAVGDEAGRVALFPPYGEGLWSTLAAGRGVIATVERLVTASTFDAVVAAAVVPASRVLAVCEAPRGARPQPLYAPATTGVGYPDDFPVYVAWAPYTRRESDRVMTVRAARVVARRVITAECTAILAGVGQSYLVARLAAQMLRDQGRVVPILAETGLIDIGGHRDPHNFLLGYEVIAGAAQRLGIEEVLGALTCGADNRCLAVVGAAQIDATGAINTTRLADGTILTGSGGAHDIAAAAAEVVVLVKGSAHRLVPAVDYVTSVGNRVLRVVTDRATLARAETGWVACDWSDEPAALSRWCRWDPCPKVDPARMPAITAQERSALDELWPQEVLV